LIKIVDGKNRIETETYVNMAYEVISACENKSGDQNSGKFCPLTVQNVS